MGHALSDIFELQYWRFFFFYFTKDPLPDPIPVCIST